VQRVYWSADTEIRANLNAFDGKIVHLARYDGLNG